MLIQLLKRKLILVLIDQVKENPFCNMNYLLNFFAKRERDLHFLNARTSQYYDSNLAKIAKNLIKIHDLRAKDGLILYH